MGRSKRKIKKVKRLNVNNPLIAQIREIDHLMPNIFEEHKAFTLEEKIRLLQKTQGVISYSLNNNAEPVFKEDTKDCSFKEL